MGSSTVWRLPLALWITCCAGSLGAQQGHPFARLDPDKITTAEACGECHAAELEVWKRTPHATGFKTLHRKASAEAIRDRLGLRLIKRESPCLKCHYTPTLQNGELRAASGVSCESCHGAGRDWIDVHNDYGGKGFDHTNETPEHRARRIEQSRRAGMRRPSDLYPVATSCFGCHTVPDEELVNVGGHSIGSGDFELVAWSQGEIRHNFLQSLVTGGGAANAERGIERKRLMYVAGRAAALEYSLRGVASATVEGVYLKAMQRRVRSALVEVRAIARRAELPEVDAMVDAVRSVQVGLGHSDALLAAAETVGAAARQLLDRLGERGAASLAGLDPLVLGLPDELDDEEEIEIAEEPSATPEATPAGPVAGSGAAADTTSTVPAADGSPARPRTSGAVPAVGEFKRKIHPSSRFATLGPGACNKCHAPQNQWWLGDAHFRSADPFFDEAPENARIARLYGLKTSQMLRGDQVCMDCHGSIVSGREKRSVQDGVGCESCHGPAAEYKEPHQEGDKALGSRRPGYLRALELGMTELQDAEVRGRTCTGCHYITEPRLISAGHPSGKAFDYLEGMKKIEHWESDPAAGALQGAFAKVLGERGPIPKVQLARLGGAAPASPQPARDRGPTPGDLERSLRPRPRAEGRAAQAPGAVQTLRPESGVASGDAPPIRDLDLPPFPEIDATTSVEEILLLVKERFELLYRKIYRPPGESP